MRLNHKSIYYMTIKSCRNLKRQIQSTYLHISYTYFKYLSNKTMVPVAEWLAHFRTDSYIKVSSRVGRKFFFRKKRHKGLLYRRLNCD